MFYIILVCTLLQIFHINFYITSELYALLLTSSLFTCLLHLLSSLYHLLYLQHTFVTKLNNSLFKFNPVQKKTVRCRNIDNGTVLFSVKPEIRRQEIKIYCYSNSCLLTFMLFNYIHGV